tara:strand:- start:227 stop:1063 length:837 start_codon:yes stop_codon:yes gene_type:complete
MTTSEAAPSDSGAIDSGGSMLSAEQPAITSNPMEFNPTGLPDGLGEEPSLQTFDSVDKLAKSYVNLVKKMGVPAEQLLRLPGEGEPMDDVYNALGRPEDHNGYQLGDFQPEQTENFRQFAHQLGLNNQQAETIYQAYQQDIAERDQASQQEFEQFEVDNLSALQEEWGDQFNHNLEMARRAFMNFATPEAVQVIEETGMGNHPELLKVFARIGEVLAEDSVLPGTNNSVLGGMNAASAQEQINSLMSDKEFRQSYMDAYDPSHQEAVAKMTKLHSYLG